MHEARIDNVKYYGYAFNIYPLTVKPKIAYADVHLDFPGCSERKGFVRASMVGVIKKLVDMERDSTEPREREVTRVRMVPTLRTVKYQIDVHDYNRDTAYEKAAREVASELNFDISRHEIYN